MSEKEKKEEKTNRLVYISSLNSKLAPRTRERDTNQEKAENAQKVTKSLRSKQ